MQQDRMTLTESEKRKIVGHLKKQLKKSSNKKKTKSCIESEKMRSKEGDARTEVTSDFSKKVD